MPKADGTGWADAMRARRVVVTGGAGFLGAHVCGALLDAGAEVVCVDNLSSGRLHKVEALIDHPSGFSFVNADVVDEIDVPGDVDFVLHLACVGFAACVPAVVDRDAASGQ